MAQRIKCLSYLCLDLQHSLKSLMLWQTSITPLYHWKDGRQRQQNSLEACGQLAWAMQPWVAMRTRDLGSDDVERRTDTPKIASDCHSCTNGMYMPALVHMNMYTHAHTHTTAEGKNIAFFPTTTGLSLLVCIQFDEQEAWLTSSMRVLWLG